MDQTALEQSLYDLVVETSTNLPLDVRRAVAAAAARERPGTQSSQALSIIARSVDMSRERTLPVCQDTGMPTFEVRCPVGYDERSFTAAARSAVIRATADGRLRPNSVDSLTGRNSGDNVGPGMPVVHFEQWSEPDVEVLLLLKGGGCENKNIQYSLPCVLDGVGRCDRNLEGVYGAIMHAVYQAQGQGCSVGALGVCVGGDRANGYAEAKRQLFRSLEDSNPDPVLAELEQRVMSTADGLGIGTMGFGGDVTLLACKIAALNRLPASFFVSVAYNCWAFRRLGVRLGVDGELHEWMFRYSDPQRLCASEEIPLTGREVHLTSPISEEQARSLKVGDVVVLDGAMHTGRDALHKHLMSNPSPVDLAGGVIYHCGPVMVRSSDGRWQVNAAGPTTSIREEPYQAEVLRRVGARVIIGKGGMGSATLRGLGEVGAVYLNAVGGAAAFYADRITSVTGVDFLDEFGVPEAMWHLDVTGFAAVVTMDSHGNSLHADVEASSLKQLATMTDKDH